MYSVPPSPKQALQTHPHGISPSGSDVGETANEDGKLEKRLTLAQKKIMSFNVSHLGSSMNLKNGKRVN